MFKRKKKVEKLRVLSPLNEGAVTDPDLPTPVCLTVYLAAESPLPLIEWLAETPGFYVTALESKNDQLARAQFAVPHVYYAGSHTHCGCGFNYGRISEFERNADELAQKRHTLATMSEYLAREIGRVGEIELFACRDDDQTAAPELHRELTPSSLLSESFFFYERELSVIREDAA